MFERVLNKSLTLESSFCFQKVSFESLCSNSMCQLLSSVFIKLTSSSTRREKSPNTDFFLARIFSYLD